MATERVPRIGVAALVYGPDGKVVVGKRKGAHGAGTWGLAGGHLEFGEEVTVCAERETLEETGLRVRAVRVAAITNVFFEADDKHYITFFVHCEMLDPDAQPEILEPEKCDGWAWKSIDELRRFIPPVSQAGEYQGERLFLPLERLVQQMPDVNMNDLRL